MGFSIEISVPIIAVFLQGILSFFSPCILPIVPLYISYLSGNCHGRIEIDKDENVYGYVEGAMTGEIMESIVKQTMEGK